MEAPQAHLIVPENTMLEHMGLPSSSIIIEKEVDTHMIPLGSSLVVEDLKQSKPKMDYQMTVPLVFKIAPVRMFLNYRG